MFCGYCGSTIREGAAFCPNCGQKVLSAENNQPAENNNQFFEQSSSDSVKKGKGLKILPVVIAAVVVIIVGVLGVSIFGGSSDAYKVFQAAKKTVFDTQSATIRIDLPYDDTYIAKVDFGKDFDDSTFYLEERYDGDTDGLFGVLDGIFYIYYEGEYDLEELFSMMGIPESELRVFANFADELIDKGINEKAFEDFYNTIIRERIADILVLNSMSSAQIEQYYDPSTGTYDVSGIEIPFEIPDYDTVMDVVKKFLVKGLSDDAISIDKKGDVYNFDIDPGKFLECLLEFAEENKVVRSIIEGCAKIYSMDSYELYDELEEEVEYLKDDFDENIRGELRIENGCLTYIKFRIFGETISVSISDIGETEVNESKIKNIYT